jgi:hypothetical protein
MLSQGFKIFTSQALFFKKLVKIWISKWRCKTRKEVGILKVYSVRERDGQGDLPNSR